ncbi:MAG: AraC family transcriptional regulator [Lachnospira sp.]|nr:AraC family transcriptional regulator [Lachnospira sp.]
MPLPLLPNENVYIDHKILYNYSMPAMQAATDHYNIGFIVSGDRRWISNECIRTGHSGDIGIAKPGVYHRNCSISDTPYERYVLKIRTEIFKPVIDIIGNETLNSLCTNYLHFSKNSQKTLYNMCEEMLNEYNKKTPASQLILQGMVYKFFFYIYDNHIKSSTDNPIYYLNSFDPRIQEALVFAERNLKNGASIESTAHYVSLSTSHFSRLFKKVTGTSYSDYINEIRIEHAKIMLELGKYSIDEIAEAIGLSSGNYLCTVFKKKYNITPSQYKKQLSNSNIHTILL